MVTSVENTMVTLGNAKKEDICNIVRHRFDDLLPADVVLLQEGSGNLNLHLVSGAKEGAERGAAGALLLEEKLLLPPLLLKPQLLLPLLFNPQLLQPQLLLPLLLNPELLQPQLFLPLLLNPQLFKPQLLLPLLFNSEFFEPGLLTPLGDLLDPDLLKSLLLGKSSCLGLLGAECLGDQSHNPWLQDVQDLGHQRRL